MSEKLEELYIRYEEVKNSLNSLLAERNVLDNELTELNLTLNVLDEFKNLKKGSEILSPIGSGIFVKSSVVDNEELIVNVGAKVLKNMELKEAKDFIDRRIKSVEKVMKEMDQKIAELAQSLQIIEQKLQEVYKTGKS